MAQHMSEERAQSRNSDDACGALAGAHRGVLDLARGLAALRSAAPRPPGLKRQGKGQGKRARE